MAAGMASGANDPHNLEIANLIHNNWPMSVAEQGRGPLKREFSTTAHTIGLAVPCHAGQSFVGACRRAGQSERISAAYQKTGVRTHRAEDGFRDKRAECTLTEIPPDYHYGTMRQTMRGTGQLLPANSIHGSLPSAGSMVLRVPSPACSRRSQQSKRSHSSSVGGGSRRSRSTSGSRVSHTPHTPSWFEERSAPWNFDPLPMYSRTNQSYGSGSLAKLRSLDHSKKAAAGHSHTGWLEQGDLVKTLTRHDGLQI